MRDYMAERAVEEGKYIVEHNATVREAAKIFHAGKSTVHKDVTERLYWVDRELGEQVRKVLDVNLSERHIRGGIATKKKFLRKEED